MYISSQCAPDSRVNTSFNNHSNEDKSPDLEKLKEPRLTTWKIHLLPILILTVWEIIDLGEIMSYFSPDYLLLKEMKLDDSFPSAQFSIPDYKIIKLY